MPLAKLLDGPAMVLAEMDFGIQSRLLSASGV